ncbi:hypothetical protein E3P86_00042 [Wallemia ichthyophaga]|uniref:Minor extracellular protease vpr n=1 Tax=Wallemia ichthyophaga TaxID=245174 RepID=A0A4T0JJG6_WALIC|nr:hypothetical protein E3P86_00042 [Wallemia ichthyophaga]
MPRLFIILSFCLVACTLAVSSWSDSRAIPKTTQYALELADGHAPHDSLFQQLQSRDIPYTLTQSFNSPDLFVGAAIHLQNSDHSYHLPSLESVKHVYPINSFDSPNAFTEVVNTEQRNLAESSFTPSLYPLVSGTQAQPSFYAVQTLSQSVLDMSGLAYAHAQNLTGSGIFIAFVDDGVDYSHPALGGCFGAGCPISRGWDLVGDAYNTTNNILNPGPLPITTCKSHGTSTLGFAASQLRELPGGAPNATYGMYRIFGCHGSSGDDVLAMGLIRAYEDGADIINVSAGGPDGWTTSLPSVVASRIVQRGRHVVTSAGNYGQQGLLYSNSPAGGIGVTPVAALDLPYVPVLNASLTVAELPGERFPYIPEEVFGAGNETRRSYVVDDACGGVSAAEMGSLDDLALIIDSSTDECDLSTKLANLKTANASLVLITDTHSNLTQAPHVGGLDTALLRTSVASAIPHNGTLTLHYTPQLTHIPRGGLVAQYSSMGPSADGYGKPAVSAIGSNIPTPAPNNSYMIQSGTSFSAPVYASLLALLLEKHAIDDVHLSPEQARAIMVNSAQSVRLAVDADDGDAFTVLQGNGRTNIARALAASAYATPDIVNLNDTWGADSTGAGAGEKSAQVQLVNLSQKRTTYTLAHHPALTGYVLEEGTIQPSTYLPPYSNDTATVKMAHSVSVEPLSSVDVDIVFTPPQCSDHRLPIYSGFIEFTDAQDVNNTLHISYNGIAGNLSQMTILDNTDDFFQQGFPVPFTYRSSDRTMLNDTNTLTFSLEDDDRPALVYRLAGPSPYLRIDLVGADTERNRTTSSITIPAQESNNNSRRTSRSLADGVMGWMADLLGGTNINTNTNTHVDSDVKNNSSTLTINTLGILYEELGVSRNGFKGSGQGSSFYRYDMNTFADGAPIPTGEYKFLLRALKVHGDEHDSADYESWLSDAFKVI